jgi:L-ribulokinase
MAADARKFLEGCTYVNLEMSGNTPPYKHDPVTVNRAVGHNVINASHHQAAAREKGVRVHTYVTDLASDLEPGDTGLVALDWFNGNKSILANSRLSGMILGLTIHTKPEHIYRALMEATAYGCREVLEAYEKNGVPIKEIVACGGIAVKNPFMMQLYADVLGKPLRVSTCTQAAALGAAIMAASAAGEGDIFEAARRMGADEYLQYQPDPAHQEKYEQLYSEYAQLHDYFGRGENKVMERLTIQRKI